MTKRKIIIDCDPGIDDAFALLIAAAKREELELLAVTTVAGNLGIDVVTDNALRLTELLKLEVPVARGAAEPLCGSLVTAEMFHGKHGLGYAKLPEPKKKVASENGVLFLYETIGRLQEEEKVTLVATGPLTNLGLLLKVFPEVKEKIQEIVLMGGSASGGNVTAAAEFNIYVDPEAAKIVFESGLPIVMCGLDVTRMCYLDRKQVAKLCQSGNSLAGICGDMLGYMLDTRKGLMTSSVTLHDAVTLVYLLHPEYFKGETMPVEIDCSDSPSRGRTICDERWWDYEEEEYPVKVLQYGDTKKFQEFMIEAIFEAGSELE